MNKVFKLRILYLAAYSKFDSNSGDSIHLQEIIRNLSRKNKLFIITQLKKGRVIEIDNVKIKRIKVLSVFRDLSIAVNTIRIGTYIFKKFKPDVIYERVENYGIGCFLGKLYRIPVVIEINGLLLDERQVTRTYHEYNSFLFHLSNKFNMSVAKKIIVVTDGIKNSIIKNYKVSAERIIVVQNGANIDLFKPMDKSIVKKDLSFDEDAYYICFVGNFVPWQGVEYLIKAAPLVLEAIKNVKFLIVGDGMMRINWENLVKEMGLSDKFVFTGAVAYENVPKYINASDICVAPFTLTRNEKIGLSPLKIYEYLACEKPVIGSNIKGVGDFLEEFNIGFSFSPEDHVELANVIIKLLPDHKLRDNMGKFGRKIIVENYSWRYISEKIEDICLKTLNDKNDE